jgi:hypothetical protein
MSLKVACTLGGLRTPALPKGSEAMTTRQNRETSRYEATVCDDPPMPLSYIGEAFVAPIMPPTRVLLLFRRIDFAVVVP